MRESRVPQELTIIAESVSTSGKYAIALGQHFDPILCYDVVSLNRVTGECIRRHYRAKDEAYAFWNEFRTGMTKPIGPSEEEEHDRLYVFNPKPKPN